MFSSVRILIYVDELIIQSALYVIATVFLSYGRRLMIDVEPSKMEVTTYIVIWHTVFIVGMIPIILGNSLIIVSMVRYEKLQSSMNIFVGNLAVADLMVGAVLIPLSLIGDYFGFKNEKYFCLTKLAIFNTSLGCSCYNLLLISIERYISITRPLHKHKYLTTRKIVFMITFGWIFNGINSFLPVSGWNAYTNSTIECFSDLVWDKGYKLYTNWLFLVINVVNIILYGTVMRVALKRTKSTKLGKHLNVHTRAKRDLRHLKTMIIVFGLFAICWAPYLAAAVVVTFHETSTTQFIRRCTLIAGFLNSAVNWIVYGYRNKDFRFAFVKILHLERCCKALKNCRNTCKSGDHVENLPSH